MCIASLLCRFNRSIHYFVVACCLFVVPLFGCHRRTEDNSDDQLNSWIEHQEQLRAQFRDSAQNASDTKTRESQTAKFTKDWLLAVDQLLHTVKRRPETPGARSALIWIVKNSDSDYDRHIDAAHLLLRLHAESPELATALHRLDGLAPVYEQLLRSISEKNRSLDVRAQAAYELAMLLRTKAEYRQLIDDTPELTATRFENFQSRSMRAKEILEALEQADAPALLKEAEALLRSVGDSHAKVTYRASTLGELASVAVKSMEEPVLIMAPVPDTQGTDLDGRSLSLKENLGKVTVLVFWASWCSACLERIPEENKLIDLYADRPFVLLGVNGDEDLLEAKKCAESNRMRFSSFADNTHAIAKAWNVTYWPTVVVIDKLGRLRCRDVSGSALRSVIDKLLAETE